MQIFVKFKLSVYGFFFIRDVRINTVYLLVSKTGTRSMDALFFIITKQGDMVGKNYELKLLVAINTTKRYLCRFIQYT